MTSSDIFGNQWLFNRLLFHCRAANTFRESQLQINHHHRSIAQNQNNNIIKTLLCRFPLGNICFKHLLQDKECPPPAGLPLFPELRSFRRNLARLFWNHTCAVPGCQALPFDVDIHESMKMEHVLNNENLLQIVRWKT